MMKLGFTLFKSCHWRLFFHCQKVEKIWYNINQIYYYYA